MAKSRMSAQDIHDRMEAYNEIINHLDQDWTRDSGEYEQGQILAEILRAKSEKWFHEMMNRNDGRRD